MKKVVIHVGLHKTATTFLQENVWPQLKTYTCLSRPFTQCNHVFNQLQYADDSLYRMESVIEEIARIGGGNLLISDECLSGKPIFFSYINRSIIAKRLKKLFPDATILLFIRDQKDLMVSHYNSYVKMPFGVKKPDELFWKPRGGYTYADYLCNRKHFLEDTLYYNANDFFIHLDCFLYSHLIDCYSRQFENLDVFIYEEFKENKEVVMERLAGILGERIVAKTDKRKNVSLSCAQLERRRRANIASSFTSNRYIKRAARICLSLGMPSSNVNLPNLISDHVGNYYSADNEMLKKTLPTINWQGFPGKYI